MKKLFAVMAVAGGLFAAMPASADVIEAAGLYVDTSDASVWQESNGEAGLQKDGNNPDTRLA